MDIVLVSEKNLRAAAEVHGASWRKSHEEICSESFIAAHTTERQMEYIRDAMKREKCFHLLMDDSPVAVAAVADSIISDLYVLPSQQRKGYGTYLLRHAVAQCPNTPTLWILNTNESAKRLYQREGFYPTGVTKELSGSLYEIEMMHKEGCST